jgi:hypothetical protein
VQKSRAIRFSVITLAISLIVNLASPSVARAAVPALSQGAIQSLSKFDGVTFYLGNVSCFPEGSGFCNGGGPAAYVLNDEGWRVTDIVWQYSVNNGPWLEVSHTCALPILFSTDTWCGSNWFFDTLTVGNLSARDVVRARASLKNSEGNSEWMLSVGNTGTYAVDTVRTDVATARITSNDALDSLVTEQSVALSGAHLDQAVGLFQDSNGT